MKERAGRKEEKEERKKEYQDIEVLGIDVEVRIDWHGPHVRVVTHNHISNNNKREKEKERRNKDGKKEKKKRIMKRKKRRRGKEGKR